MYSVHVVRWSVQNYNGGVNDETRAHRAWLACGPVGLVPVPRRSVGVQQGQLKEASIGLTTFENFSYLQNHNEVGISSTTCGCIGCCRTY